MAPDANEPAGIMFYMADGKVVVNGNASIDLTGPYPPSNVSATSAYCDSNSCPYQGMIFVGASGNANPMTFNGTGDTKINGIIYSAKGAITYSGNNGTDGTCLRIAANIVTMTGNSKLDSDCNDVLGDNEIYTYSTPYFTE